MVPGGAVGTDQGGVEKPVHGISIDDHNVWKCGGRLGRADLPYSTRHPVLLPKKHPFHSIGCTESSSQTYSFKPKGHFNGNTSRFWIPQG